MLRGQYLLWLLVFPLHFLGPAVGGPGTGVEALPGFAAPAESFYSFYGQFLLFDYFCTCLFLTIHFKKLSWGQRLWLLDFLIFESPTISSTAIYLCPTKVCLVKAIVFPVIMYGCESWTIKKAECQRIDAFELWCWNRLLWVPWTARRSSQSILKEISPAYSLEGLMLMWKLQYFGHLVGRTDSF